MPSLSLTWIPSGLSFCHFCLSVVLLAPQVLPEMFNTGPLPVSETSLHSSSLTSCKCGLRGYLSTTCLCHWLLIAASLFGGSQSSCFYSVSFWLHGTKLSNVSEKVPIFMLTTYHLSFPNRTEDLWQVIPCCCFWQRRRWWWWWYFFVLFCFVLFLLSFLHPKHLSAVQHIKGTAEILGEHLSKEFIAAFHVPLPARTSLTETNYSVTK